MSISHSTVDSFSFLKDIAWRIHIFRVDTHLAIYQDTVANEIPHRRWFVIPSRSPSSLRTLCRRNYKPAPSRRRRRWDRITGLGLYQCITVRGSDARAPRSTIIIPIEHTRVACRTPRHRASHRGVHSFMLGPWRWFPVRAHVGAYPPLSRSSPRYIS